MERTIESSFTFDAGHRIVGIEPIEEQAIHGHTFNFKVIIKSKLLNKNGIIFDRNELLKIIQPFIKELDHSCLLFDKYPLVNDLKELAKKYKFEHKIISLDVNPTIEGLIDYLFRRIKKLLPIENKIEIRLKTSESLESSYLE